MMGNAALLLWNPESAPPRGERRRLSFKLAYLLERCQPGLGSLPVLIRGGAADADGTDDTPADHDRQPALDRRDARQSEKRVASLGDAVLEYLAGAAERRRGARFLDGDVAARRLGVIHLLEVDERTVVVHDRDRSEERRVGKGWRC